MRSLGMDKDYNKQDMDFLFETTYAFPTITKIYYHLANRPFKEKKLARAGQTQTLDLNHQLPTSSLREAQHLLHCLLQLLQQEPLQASASIRLKKSYSASFQCTRNIWACPLSGPGLRLQQSIEKRDVRNTSFVNSFHHQDSRETKKGCMDMEGKGKLVFLWFCASYMEGQHWEIGQFTGIQQKVVVCNNEILIKQFWTNFYKIVFHKKLILIGSFRQPFFF